MSDADRIRILGLVAVERLQSEGRSALERGEDANGIADRLLTLSRRTSDRLVSEMAMLAQAGIASGQLATAAAALGAVNDQIATATNAFATAARIANEGEAGLTFPFVAGKVASLLDLVKALQHTVESTRGRLGEIDGMSDLLLAFESAKGSVAELKTRTEKLVGSGTSPSHLSV